MIFGEATQVDARGKGYVNTPGIHSEGHVAEWRKITNAVHAAGGRIVLQLWHVVRISHVSLQPGGPAPLAPSAIRAEQKTFTVNGFEDCSEPEALTVEGIAEVVEQFRRGAVMAQSAGFDGVEIHSANGYPLDQFLQNKSNRRTDDYGGTIENRMRLLSEVIDAVATVWPRERIGIRLSPLGQANDMGDTDPEALFAEVYKLIDHANLAYLHVVEEFYGVETSEEEKAILTRLRALYSGFFIANGGYDAERAAAAIESGHADAVSFGRPFIANPDLPQRFRTGATLNPPDSGTFYGGDDTGYTDYPFVAGAAAA